MPRIARPARQCQGPLGRLGGIDHFAQVTLLIRGQQQSSRLTRLAEVRDGAGAEDDHLKITSFGRFDGGMVV